MKITKIGKAVLISAAVMTFWGVAPGCGPSAGSYCNKVCSCGDCSDAEREECIDTVLDARNDSGGSGCLDEFNDYFSCIDDATICLDGYAQSDGCETEADALATCGGAVTLGRDPCRRYVDHLFAKFAECGIDLGGGEVPDDGCSAENAKFSLCLDPCIEELTCDYLNNPQANPGAAQAYNDCTLGCE